MDNSIIAQLQLFNISNIEGVRFFQNDGKSYSLSLDSVKRIALYTEKKYGKNIFAPGELSIEKNYFVENYKSTLSAEDYKLVVDTLTGWLESGGRFDILYLPEKGFIHRLEVLLYGENEDSQKRFTKVFLEILVVGLFLMVCGKLFPKTLGNYISLIFFLLMNIAFTSLIAVKFYKRKELLGLLLIFLISTIYLVIKVITSHSIFTSFIVVVSPFPFSRVFTEALIWLILLISIYIVGRKLNYSLNKFDDTHTNGEHGGSNKLLKTSFILASIIPLVNLLFTICFKIYTEIGGRYNNILRKIFESIYDFTSSIGWFLPSIAFVLLLITKIGTIKKFFALVK